MCIRDRASSVEGIVKKLLLLYTGPYTITQDKGNNTYELSTPDTKEDKGVYNQAKIKKRKIFEKPFILVTIPIIEIIILWW